MEEYKFKIGDKVRIISTKETDNILYRTKCVVGKEYEITDKGEYLSKLYYRLGNEESNAILESDLELVVDKKKNQDFKVGDKVEIVYKGNHNFEVGEIVKIVSVISDDSYYANGYIKKLSKIADQIIRKRDIKLITKTNNMNSKQFKNNFGVISDSEALIEAFIKEVEKLGWKREENEIKNRTSLYFANHAKKGSINHLSPNHFWYSSGNDSNPYNLPTQWDEAIKAASETIPNIEEYKVGDYVVMEKAGGWGYSPDNNGCIGLVNRVGTQNSWNTPTVPVQSIYGTILNPKNEDTAFNGIPCFDKNARNPYSQPLVRKATKEEIEEATKLKVGDWVMCLEGYSNSYGDKYAGAGYITGKPLQIREINNNTSLGENSEKGNYIYWFNNHSSGVYSNFIRKATKEEIEKHSSVTIAGYTAEREGSLIAFGCQKFSNQQLASYRELLTRDAFSAELTIKGTKITVEILDKLLAMLK